MVFSYVNAGYTGSDWDGATLFNPITAGPIGLHTGSFTGLVRRRRRREQSGHLRYQRPRLVHEDRIPRGLLRQQERQYPCRWFECGHTSRYQLQAAGADRQHLAGLSLQLDRSGRPEVLIQKRSIQASGKCPGIVRGFFLCLFFSLEIIAAIGDAVPCSCATRSRAPLSQPLRRLTGANLIEGKPMRKLFLVAGLLALAIGLLWIGQGTGAIKWPQSSFMISQIQWAGYGAALAAFGLILIWQGKH